MKKILKTTFLLFAVQLTLMTHVFASSRVDNVITEDEQVALDSLLSEKRNLSRYKSRLHKIEQRLRMTRKGQNIYVRFDKVAGSLVLTGIVIGSYKAYFPPGMRATVGAYLTVKGLSHGLIRLSEAEALSVLNEITALEKQIRVQEQFIFIEIKRYCKSGANHLVCY